MANFTKTWWGDVFIDALERDMDAGRISRGGTYARTGRILDFQLSADGKITATVLGRINPYFGVYEVPEYKTTIEIKPISKSDWKKVIKLIGEKASFVSMLLMNEMPDHIENAFSELDLNLLPKSSDLITHCSCPDYANPCKHIAGVYYLLASELDDNPFLMFKLRGLEQKELQKQLAKTSLGKLLVSEMEEKEIPINKTTSFHTRPQIEKVKNINLKEFWMGRRLPEQAKTTSTINVPATLIKKQGDYPPFWDNDTSFITVMEEMYQRIRTKNRKIL